jgi:hypothetical protein
MMQSFVLSVKEIQELIGKESSGTAAVSNCGIDAKMRIVAQRIVF